MCGQMPGRALLPHRAETRFSEKTLDHFHVWAPEINLKCLAAIEVGREILFQQNTNILLNSGVFSPRSASQSLLALVNTYIIALRCLFWAHVCFL